MSEESDLINSLYPYADSAYSGFKERIEDSLIRPAKGVAKIFKNKITHIPFHSLEAGGGIGLAILGPFASIYPYSPLYSSLSHYGPALIFLAALTFALGYGMFGHGMRAIDKKK